MESPELDFRTDKGAWLVWNMLTYKNDIVKACDELRDKENADINQ